MNKGKVIPFEKSMSKKERNRNEQVLRDKLTEDLIREFSAEVERTQSIPKGIVFIAKKVDEFVKSGAMGDEKLIRLAHAIALRRIREKFKEWDRETKRREKRMAEIADDMIDGACCSQCGIYFKESHGFPVLCSRCFDSAEPERKAEYQKATIAET